MGKSRTFVANSPISVNFKTENGFHLKRNVCEFRRNENRLSKTGVPQIFFVSKKWRQFLAAMNLLFFFD